MKKYSLLLFFLFASLLSFHLNAEPDISTLKTGTMEVDKTILVTFVDRTISRKPIASLTGSYSHSTSYQSSTWSRNITNRLANQYQLKRIFEWPMTALGVQCVVFKVSDDKSVDDILETLAKDEQVKSAQRMKVFHMYAATPRYKDPYYKLQTNVHKLRLEDAHRLATGKNIKIALIDTGVDFQHPDLEGQIIPDNNFAFDISESFTDDLHGTAVAGIIAAHANNGIGIVGVAPNAQLYAIKACWPQRHGHIRASCNTLTLALAINRAIKMNVDILNLSLGGPKDPLIAQLINAAVAKGIVIIASDPGIDHPQERFPAKMASVIGVGMAKYPTTTEKTIENYTITAPGNEILTTLPQATYDFISGCSFAAAHITGIVALLLEIDPNLSQSRISNLLKTANRIIVNNSNVVVDAYTLTSKVKKLSL